MSKVLTSYNIKELTGPKGLVVFFFPRALSDDCSVEVVMFNHCLKEIQELGFNVVGISTSTVELNEEFAKKEDLQYPLISDLDHSITKSFANQTTVVRDGKEIERALRTTYIVDSNNKELATLTDVNAITSATDAINKIKELEK